MIGEQREQRTPGQPRQHGPNGTLRRVPAHAAKGQAVLAERSLAAPVFELEQVVVKPEPPLKRALDLALSGAMLVASAPVWLAIAAAIKHEDSGPVFYRQQRWGRYGNQFEVLKFRTMVVDSDRRYGVQQASEDDDRVTRIGRLLRRMGLDELPQMLNIFRGEMSLVGPRALATAERDRDGHPLEYQLSPGFAKRLAVRPGLTGIATIYLPKDASPRRKFKVDLLYVERQSVWLDLRLIAMSFWISFRGKWETRGRKV
jgi:lipopolysaccharide/colanic/teichoic acid biosynthesis glycosyltransferase